jgi:hypothetical protein
MIPGSHTEKSEWRPICCDKTDVHDRTCSNECVGEDDDEEKADDDAKEEGDEWMDESGTIMG